MISGADDRRDPWLATGLDATLLRHAARTCYLIGNSAVATRRGGRVRLHHEPYGPSNSLCAEQRFVAQPVVVERPDGNSGDFGCSGYLLDAGTALTCWHGWEHFAARALLAIFGYALRRDGSDPLELPAVQLRAVAPQPVSAPPAVPVGKEPRGDWVLLRLEHPVEHLGPLARPPLATPRAGRSVYALGHPGGLPLKLADRGKVLAAGDGLLRTDLDTFTGNSGSPVFDATSHALVGVVVAGPDGASDFSPVPERGCYVASRATRHPGGQLSVAADAFAAAVAR